MERKVQEERKSKREESDDSTNLLAAAMDAVHLGSPLQQPQHQSTLAASHCSASIPVELIPPAYRQLAFAAGSAPVYKIPERFISSSNSSNSSSSNSSEQQQQQQHIPAIVNITWIMRHILAYEIARQLHPTIRQQEYQLPTTIVPRAAYTDAHLRFDEHGMPLVGMSKHAPAAERIEWYAMVWFMFEFTNVATRSAGPSRDVMPKVGGRDLNVYAMFHEVLALGGHTHLNNTNEWHLVQRHLELGDDPAQAEELKTFFEKHFIPIEEFYFYVLPQHPRLKPAVAELLRDQSCSNYRPGVVLGWEMKTIDAIEQGCLVPIPLDMDIRAKQARAMAEAEIVAGNLRRRLG